jgi:hypothetical protein
MEGRLSHQIGGRGRNLDGLPSPHRADINDAALHFFINHPLRRGLGQEEERFVDVVVLMIIFARVFDAVFMLLSRILIFVCWLFLFSGSCRRPLKMLYVITCLLLA